MPIETKICGINDPAALRAAAQHGARYIGLVFYEPSPRFVTPTLAAELARDVPTGVKAVGLFVDPADDFLDAVTGHVPLDMIQLHGKETPQRVADIRARYNMPVMKAIGIATADDLAAIDAYLPVADRLLFDAKVTGNIAALPGGNAVSFDWKLLAGRTWPKPWMLAGGLNAQNLRDAVTISGARAVDISSGVEDRPGHKMPEKIAELLALAKTL